mmetsp:Transcript_20670/g.19682  ORF Transcript_20670/g.19682 Transcript_20670/m.19682 type:complete len:111 (+) Transcript_20670:487-819(+)|eukprot:CAMPEP_0170544444 /NCGR_PEP_ID=MMETSP0211-20121228/3205_1 /TAXON_ID=311385 /ORGANISM="Pseudokeronopsis sp., Strain OXSARD2" /LENGTH=110 /DNA_ID=CAMNT_0010848101 /DNA_START=1343 /DNA_END=1675 /DNA_ORIENTATION=-
MEENENEEEKTKEDRAFVKSKKLNYLKLKELLIQLGMINEHSANSDSQERVLLYDLWKVLRGEEKEEVALNDAKLLLMVIMRITTDKRIGVQEPGEEEGGQEIGFYNDND